MKLIGDGAVDPSVLATLKERGGRWAAYQNAAGDSVGCGQLVFLKVGEDCSFKEPPPHAPDGPYGTGWKYLHVGHVNLDTGKVEGA